MQPSSLVLLSGAAIVFISFIWLAYAMYRNLTFSGIVASIIIFFLVSTPTCFLSQERSWHTAQDVLNIQYWTEHRRNVK